MYFKILKEDLNHDGFQYHEGLNIDSEPLDSTPNNCGGLFFTNQKHILNFGYSGTKIATVAIPEGEEVVPVNKKYKAHQIILSDIRDLWTLDTFKWLATQGVNPLLRVFVLFLDFIYAATIALAICELLMTKVTSFHLI